MNYFKLNQDVCRICLEHKVKQDWNENIFEFCGTSYKDCYYKYTKLEESDPDYYSTKLCEFCANDLKNAHKLFEKAIKSFKFLQELDIWCIEKSNNSTGKCEIGVLESTTDDDSLIETDSKIHLSPLCDNDKNSETENRKKESLEISTNEHTIEEPAHFSESSDEIPLEEESSTTEFNENKYDTISFAPMESSESLIDDSKCLPPDNKPAKSSKEKYIFMCSYCSLKVYGITKLDEHEATHNVNRERKYTCSHCGLKLYTYGSLNLHLKIHDTNRQRNHKCEYCEKSFFNKGTLTVHMRRHLGLTIKCQICEKEFYRKSHLNRHLSTHSSSSLGKNVETKKYLAECQYCNKLVLTNKLREHVAVHLDQHQMKCKICDKNFFCRSKCTNHLRRFHRKNQNEFDKFIHYYVDRNERLSHLLTKQQLPLQLLTK